MKYGQITWALLLAGAALAGAGELKPGDRMPLGELKMENVDGRRLSIQEVAGKNGMLVIFACNHCPFVKAWEARMTALGNDSVNKGIGVVLVNANDAAAYPMDDLAHMKQQAEAAGFQFPYVVDETSDVARAFGASRTPEAFLFDAAGQLVYRGAIDDNAHEPDQVRQRYLQEAVDALLAGKAPPVPETSSVGCGIKFREKPAEGT